ncbi:hypothetical protein CEXT_345671 [Caerostris extrusa]|uniref:Uncharacterized protein n=1 Tax=Caerostris extrusa TaxID=172846 RepID=A0AAV4PYM5_CAEEX|nr:hypothetical protein CEXT_345671 [Caerostris extrusa]
MWGSLPLFPPQFDDLRRRRRKPQIGRLEYRVTINERDLHPFSSSPSDKGVHVTPCCYCRRTFRLSRWHGLARSWVRGVSKQCELGYPASYLRQMPHFVFCQR